MTSYEVDGFGTDGRNVKGALAMGIASREKVRSLVKVSVLMGTMLMMVFMLIFTSLSIKKLRRRVAILEIIRAIAPRSC